MNTSDVLLLLGGLALFLYGMQMMSNGLETTAGNKMKEILEKLTSTRIKGVLAGALITAVIQSSSATTVMVVGFVNSGLMTLNQAVWVIMGANIGTTITGQLIALDIGSIAPLIAFVSVTVILFSKNEKARHIASIFAGLGVLFIGMGMMGNAMEPLQNSETFLRFMTSASNPLIGILVGAVFTAIIQSSSASVGILQALAATGMVPLSSAVFILFGQNIGTCITAVLASIGTKANAKRTTVIHLMFNIIGTIIFTVICMATPFVSWMEMLNPNPVAQVANVHTTFNIVTTLLLLPFGNMMAEIAQRILPDSEVPETPNRILKYIAPFDGMYVMGHGAVAISQLEQEVTRMYQMAVENVKSAYDALLTRNMKSLEEITDREAYIDFLNEQIARYIVSLMPMEMSEEDAKRINSFYMIIGNIERIGDHAMNIAEYLNSMQKWAVSFSDSALAEIEKMKDISMKILEHIHFSVNADYHIMLYETTRYETLMDDMQKKFLKRQLKRARKGDCKAEEGILYSELLTDFERIGDNARNLAEICAGMN